MRHLYCNCYSQLSPHTIHSSNIFNIFVELCPPNNDLVYSITPAHLFISAVRHVVLTYLVTIATAIGSILSSKVKAQF